MLKKLIDQHIEENVKNKDSVAILFSGGMDSLSLLLSCLSMGIKPKLYNFRLDNHISNDNLASKRIAEIYGLDLNEILIDTKSINLIDDVTYIIDRFKVKKKTQVQCIHPFLYVIPKIKEEYILSGLCADDLYGTPRSLAKLSGDSELFYNKRLALFNKEESSSYKFIKELIESYNKTLVAPYKQSLDIAEFMLSKSYKELHSPKQKNIMYEDYKDELVKNNLHRKNSNLQCDSKIREWHDELLDSNLNQSNYKSVVGIYNTIYKKITK